jgi:3',5'-cyclic AMP phosphodiesterase CpdA
LRIVHLSDLHFGHHDPEVAASLANDITAQKPDLVVVSGDFTQIGTKEEFIAARAFLDTLTAPIFAVPGNHDVPAVNVLRRFLDPYGLYRKYIDRNLEPYLEIDGLVLVGLKTSRRMRLEWNWGHGTISPRQLAALEHRFAKAPPNAVRIIVAHHPLLFPATPMQQQTKVVKGADLALETFSSLGVRLVLSGHFHLSYVRKHEHIGTVKQGAPLGLRQSAAAPILIAQASSTISTRLRGEPNAYNLVNIQDGQITITVREWRGESWFTREKASEPA